MQESVVSENIRIAQAIDHTRLTFSPEEDEVEVIDALCREAREHGFYAVCVCPRHVHLCKMLLGGSSVKVATVIGFPARKVLLENELKNPTVGGFSTREKLAEIDQAVRDGADELDLVINVAQLKTDRINHQQKVLNELRETREHASGRPIKVIIEIDLLSSEEIVQATRWCAEAGMAMVKTSTGMVTGGRGATLEAVSLIAKTLKAMDTPVGIKASGGIKTRETAEAFLAAGVERIGTSSGIAILQQNHSNDGNDY